MNRAQLFSRSRLPAADFSQAKGRASGMSFDNANLWSRIEN
jgi:hypothetical protein